MERLGRRRFYNEFECQLVFADENRYELFEPLYFDIIVFCGKVTNNQKSGRLNYIVELSHSVATFLHPFQRIPKVEYAAYSRS